MTCWPLELRVDKTRQNLTVTLENGQSYIVSAEKLRVESPSAEVQGHHASEKKIVLGKENITITNVEQVGHYAVRILFDDGHKTGIYTWDYLSNLGQNK